MLKKAAFSFLVLIVLLFGAAFALNAHAAQDTAVSAQTAERVTDFRISSSRISLGESVVIRLKRADSSQAYSVSYFVRSSPDAKWRRIANGENKYSVKYLPGKSLNYEFKAAAKGADGKTISKSFVVAVVKDTGKPLEIKTNAETQTIALGSSVKLKSYLTGGVSPYRYSFSYSLNGVKWKSLVKNSKLSYKKYTPAKAGYYTVVNYGKDSSGKLVQKKSELIVTNETGQELNNTTKQPAAAAVGARLTINASASGGTAPYMYEAILTSPGSDEKTVIKSLSRDPAIKLTGGRAGTYEVTVNVVDYEGNTASAVIPAEFYGDTGEELTVAPKEYPASVTAGTSVVFGAEVSGGVSPYNYQTLVRRAGGEWETVGDGTDPECTVIFEKPGYYDYKTTVTDFSGAQKETAGSLMVTLDSDKPLENSSLIINNLITTGSELKVNAAATGGSAPYTYKYYYRRVEATGWTRINRDEKQDVCTCLINTTGLFEFRVVATDQKGASSERIIRYNVVKDTGKPLKSVSTVSESIVTTGDIIGLEAKPSGGSEPYCYWYSMAYEDKGMSYIGSSRYNSRQYFKVTKAGKYTFRITVQDGRGRTVTKDTVVYTTTSEKLGVVNSCDMMEEPQWASKCAGRVYSGEEVRVIKISGRWFQVVSGKDVGWVYNMTFRNEGNYSTINEDNLPVIADDIIFTKGRDIRSLYNYVYFMSYSTDGKKSLEEMCVFMLRYRRGACYHRAALLYYLLDRAGYEVYRIDDGTDKLTAGSPHNWVIIKTDEGYRHIDATPFSFMDSFYLATDEQVEKAFDWDREKYPACV